MWKLIHLISLESCKGHRGQSHKPGRSPWKHELLLPQTKCHCCRSKQGHAFWQQKAIKCSAMLFCVGSLGIPVTDVPYLLIETGSILQFDTFYSLWTSTPNWVFYTSSVWLRVSRNQRQYKPEEQPMASTSLIGCWCECSWTATKPLGRPVCAHVAELRTRSQRDNEQCRIGALQSGIS